MMLRSLRSLRSLFILSAYTIIALVLTYPLVTQFGDHVPGTDIWAHDEYTFVWSQWWVKYSLFQLGTNPLTTQYVFYPLGLNLASFTMLWTHAVLGLPLQFAFGLVPATNVTLLSSFVIGAFGMYLLASHILRRTVGQQDGLWIIHAAAFIAGLAFAFTSARWVYAALGHYTVLATQWFPFFVLYLLKTLRSAGWKNPLMAALFASLSLYSDAAHLPLLLLLGLLLLAFEWRRLRQPALVARLFVLASATALFFLPVVIPLAQEVFLSGYQLPGFGDADKLLVDLMGFFTPTSLHPLNRHWLEELDQVRQGISRFADVNTFFVGYATAVLALAGAAFHWRRAKVWLTAALAFAILSLGPLLNVNGVSEFDFDGLNVTFPMPFLALHYIPILKENRVPNRYSILVTLALAVLIAYAVWFILQKSHSILGRRLSARAVDLLDLVVLTVVAAVLLFEHLAVPLPLSDARVPDVYSQIQQDPGEFAVLTLPLGWRNSFGQQGAEDTRVQYYQSVHQKFLLGGNTSRNSPFLFDYFARAPILSSIIALETYQDVDDAAMKRDRAAAGQFVSFFGLRYLVVSAPVDNRPPYSDTHDRVLDYLRQVLPLGKKVYDRDGTVAYRVNQSTPSQHLAINFGTDSAWLYQGEGWQPDEGIGGATGNWSTRQNAQVFIPIGELKNYKLTVRALPFEYAGHTQILSLAVNGLPAGAQTLQPGWKEYAFTLNRTILHSGLNALTFQFAYLIRPSDAVPPNFQIGKTGVASPVDIAVQSRSEYASIKVAGREVSPLKRGYDLAVIDPKTGAVLETGSFDTGGTSLTESRALRDYISALPNGVIVAGAVQEDASARLGDRAALAIQSLGLTGDLRGKSGMKHAFIAVKGQAGGLEATCQNGCDVSVGHSTDTRWLGVAFDWIQLDPQ